MDLDGKPAVILVIGVNGVGKTTTIAKLADCTPAGQAGHAGGRRYLPRRRQRAAGDLGRPRRGAARQAGEGADPAAVIFDAVKSATARGYDMVIADTAGRLHNKKGLMDELSKISRSVKKASPEASLEVLLVLDAITGPERHQPGQGVLQGRQRHRRGADQAGRHRQGRLRLGLAAAGPAHPVHRRGRKDRRPDRSPQGFVESLLPERAAKH